nr:class F sortase [Ornithinimicrobium cryptoxanthini]
MTAGRRHLVVRAACGLLLALGLSSLAVALDDGVQTPDLALGTPLSEPSAQRAAFVADGATPALPAPSLGRSAVEVLASASAPPAGAKAAAPTAPLGTSSPDGVNGEVARPTTLSIPTIDVKSLVNPLGLNADGTLEVPARGPLYDQAAWFDGSPRPGQDGPAVLLGHVNGRGGVPSVFFRLAELRVGDQVVVDGTDGSPAVFEVYLTEQYPKDAFPTAAVYGDTEGAELRLITCAGAWDAGVGHYQDNTVVYARLLPSG